MLADKNFYAKYSKSENFHLKLLNYEWTHPNDKDESTGQKRVKSQNKARNKVDSQARNTAEVALYKSPGLFLDPFMYCVVIVLYICMYVECL